MLATGRVASISLLRRESVERPPGTTTKKVCFSMATRSYRGSHPSTCGSASAAAPDGKLKGGSSGSFSSRGRKRYDETIRSLRTRFRGTVSVQGLRCRSNGRYLRQS